MNQQGPPPHRAVPGSRCPDCRAPLGDRPRACARCGILLVGPTAAHLWRIDSALSGLADRERALRTERTAVLHTLRQESHHAARPAAPAPLPPAAPVVARVGDDGGGDDGGGDDRLAPVQVPGTAGDQWSAAGAVVPVPLDVSGSAAPPQGPRPPRPAPSRVGEVTRRSAQNVILGLGGLLVGVAALVFAVWTWSDMGTGTRATVLGTTTLLFAGVAHPLYRRGLRASAETFGALAAALLGVDALALFLLSDDLGNASGYAACSLAVIVTLMALYPLAVPLAGPRVIAVLLAQPVAVLAVLAAPGGARWWWLLPAVAATALADLLVARRLEDPRPGRPVRTLLVCALLLWVGAAGASGLVLFGGDTGVGPERWWAVAVSLLLLGVTGLLFARRPLPGPDVPPRVFSGAALTALGALPLAAGPASLPALPRIPAAPWPAGNAAVTTPIAALLGIPVPEALPPLGAGYLVAVLLGAGLAVGATALLVPRLVLPAAAVAAPAALLAVPPLLGFPAVAAAVWAVLGGAALVLGTSLTRSGHLGWVPAGTGVLTVVTGVCWSLPTVHGTVAAALLVAATAFVVVLLRARTGAGQPDGPARPLYVTGAVLWALALLVGGALLAWARVTGAMTAPLGWLLAALVLVSAATALLFGRLPSPFTKPGWDDSVLPTLLTGAGLLLLPVAPLLTGPETSPVLPGPSRPHPPWSAPVSALLEPAHAVLGLPARESTAAAVGTALGVVATGALVVVVARLVDRRWTATALALAAPTALVPLPVILGLPFSAAVAWTALLGAALTLGTSRIADGSGWVPGITGALTLLLGLLWALPERHATLFVVVVVAAASLANALLLPRDAVPDPSGRISRGRWTALALGALGTAVGTVCLVSVAVVAAGPVPRWLLAVSALLVGTAMLAVGRARPHGRRRPGVGHPRPETSAFSLVGLAVLAIVPLLAGPRGAPVLAGFARIPFLTAVSPEALLRPAYAVLGLPAQPGTGTALAVASGLVLSGALAVGAVLLVARRWTTHAVALVTPSALVPVPVVLGAPFAVALVWTLVVGAALTAGSALSRDHRVAWALGASGLFTLFLGLAWSLPERYALTASLMAVAVVWAVAAALARTTVVAVAATSAATTATGAFALALPLALGAPVEYAALTPVALAAAVAAVAPRLRSPLLEAAEVPAGLWAVLAVAVATAAGVRGEVVGLALAVVGVIALASAVRPRRRWLAVVGGALMLAALWTVLGALRVTVPEAYTVVPAVAALVVGWEWSRRTVPPPSSWAAHGGGLALLLLPSVVMLLAGSDMLWRVPAVLAAGLAVAVWGLRARLQAALALGAAALLLSSLRAFGPPLWDLTVRLPNWVPFAVVGAVLLVVGARYESNLARLRRVGTLVSGMR